MLTSGIIYCWNITSSPIATKPTIQCPSDEGGGGGGEGGEGREFVKHNGWAG